MIYQSINLSTNITPMNEYQQMKHQLNYETMNLGNYEIVCGGA